MLVSLSLTTLILMVMNRSHSILVMNDIDQPLSELKEVFTFFMMKQEVGDEKKKFDEQVTI